MLFSIQEVPSQIPQDNPFESILALQRELAASKEENRKLLQDVEQKRREAGEVQHRHCNCQNTCSLNSQIRDKWTEACGEAEANARKLQQLQSEHASAMKRLDSQGNLLASRTRESIVAQQFLTTEDSVPGVDVIQMVKKLNSDILQCAAHLADTLPKTARIEPTDSEDVDVAYTRVWELGPGIFELLNSQHHKDDPSVTLQIAFQTCFIHSCACVIGSWHNDENIDTALKSLYYVLRHTGRSVANHLERNLCHANLSVPIRGGPMANPDNYKSGWAAREKRNKISPRSR